MLSDAIGNDLQVGDLLAYGVREGNVGVLRFGILTKTSPLQVKTIHGNNDWDDEKKWRAGGFANLGSVRKTVKVTQVNDTDLSSLVENLKGVAYGQHTSNQN